MTRFARAKGSKASNERVPEEATSWQTMKEQIEQKKKDKEESVKRKEFEDRRQETYKAFLEEKQNDIIPEWVEFNGKPNGSLDAKKKGNKRKIMDDSIKNDSELQGIISEIEQVMGSKNVNDNQSNKRKKKQKNEINDDRQSYQDEHVEIKTQKEKPEKENGHFERDSESTQLKKQRKNKGITNGNKPSIGFKKEPKSDVQNANSEIDDDEAPEEVSSKLPSVVPKKKPKLAQNKPLKIPSVVAKDENTNQESADKPIKDKKKRKKKQNEKEVISPKVKKSIEEMSEVDKKLIRDKKKRNKKEITSPTPKKSTEEMSEDQLKRFNKKKEKHLRQLQNRKKRKAEEKEKALMASQNETVKRQLAKPRDDKEHPRRKPEAKVQTMFINGTTVEIDYCDGFPIKKEDAERIRNLRKEMISKGIPRKEVQIALKLERRKAEKALAREKKKVCFNCRMSGHVLSECPNLNGSSQQEMIGTGICFKCGSTEHTHFECKVVRNDNFNYATCFICKQQGHISRQCPDNQKGLYPKGGACKICGDVTHLKKDCPKFQMEQESQNIKLGELDGDDLEGLPEEKGKMERRNSNRVNKVVKF